MELTFAFKNMAVNALSEFYKISHIGYYVDKIQEKSVADLFDTYVDNYKYRLPAFENEIIQICETTSQDTIDEYFHELTSDYSWIVDLNRIETIKSAIEEWNNKQLIK